jgi:hypothetical protein
MLIIFLWFNSSILNVQDDQNFIDRSLEDSEQVQVCSLNPMFCCMVARSHIAIKHFHCIHVDSLGVCKK